LAKEATDFGADDVLGIKTHIHEFAGLIECVAIGTAVKRVPVSRPKSGSLPVQAIIRDQERLDQQG
jgi:hypothetical protein